MNPVELEKELIELGLEKARTKAQAYMLEKAVKGVYAEQYMKARGDKTQGDAAQIAYTTEAYREAVRSAAEALDAAEAARVRHDALVAKFQAWQSLNASRREQIKKGIYV